MRVNINQSWDSKPVNVASLKACFGKQPSNNLREVVAKQLSLFNDREVTIYYSNGHLSGRVRAFDDEMFSMDNLPLTGVPKAISDCHDVLKYRNFFEIAHIVPEKGVDGRWNRLAVHISGRGGVREKIPFQPGLALGSVVDPTCIEKMKAYAEGQAKVEGFEKRIKALEQKIKELGQKKASTKASRSSSKDKLLTFYSAQEEALKGQIAKLVGLFPEVSDVEFELPDFPNMTIGSASPVNFSMTEVATDPRAFDSVHYSSTFIDMKESAAKIHDKMTASSSSGTISGSTGGFFFNASASHSWASAAMNRVGQIRNEARASSILVINAFVATRHVRYLKDPVVYDKGRLEAIQRELKKVVEAHNRDSREGAAKLDPDTVYVLSEAVMGGSFSAIITYLKTDEASRDLQQSARHHSSTTSASGRVFGIGASGSRTKTSSSNQYDDEVRNRANLNVEVEFIAQGTIPEITQDTVVRDTLKHVDQNLGKYKSVGSSGSMSDRRAQMEESMYAALNSARQTKVVSEKVFTHTPNTVSLAYNNFSNQMAEDPGCGVPIGFGLTAVNIKTELENIEKRENAELSASETGLEQPATTATGRIQKREASHSQTDTE